MGASLSKEELLYREVQNGNHDAVKSLHRKGASLEWSDKEGRTPLIFACSRGELLDMVITLLNLGANVNAYRTGAQGGFPLHHAAKRGLERTVTLLLSRGANPLAVNDDGHTPLDLARSKNQISVVRILEERLCLFSGMLRELSGIGFLESFAPKFVTKRVWVVVVPTKLLSRGTAAYEIAVYEPPKVSLWNGVHSSMTHPSGLCNVALPRTKILLADAEIKEPDFSQLDPVFYVTDKALKTKYKFFSENKGDKAQLEKLYKACKGFSLPQRGASNAISSSSDRTDEHPTNHQPGNLSQIHPVSSQPSPCRQPSKQPVSALFSSPVISSTTSSIAAVEPIPEDLALAMALEESIRTAAEEGVSVPLPPASRADKSSLFKKIGWFKSQKSSKGLEATNTCKHLEGPVKVGHSEQMAEESILDRLAAPSTGQPINAVPSAPPLFQAGICVICLDAQAEGACIPCGHLAGCMRCLAEIESKNRSCPVCRGPLEQVMKVYAV